MNTILDSNGKIIATVDVTEVAPGRFEGVVMEANFPNDLLALLHEFESLANDQVFALLDGVEEKIDAHKLRLCERGNALISDLQLWGDKGIHFRIAD